MLQALACLRTAVLAVLVLGAAGVVEAETVLHRGNGGEPETLDPQKSGAFWESNILTDIYEGLVTYAANGDLVPGVAESWDISGDQRTYTFHLRKDEKWSNGEPLLAADFVYSFQRAVDPATAGPYASTLAPISNVEALLSGTERDASKLGVIAKDEHTLIITLNSPTPYFLEQLRGQVAMPVPRTAIEKFGAEWTKPENIVSNGAFVLADWVPLQSITLIKNPYYHAADSVKLDKIIFYTTEDTPEEFRRFEAGELQITYHVPANKIEAARSQMADSFKNYPSLGTYYYVVNFDRKPLGTSRSLREALALAIDRETLVEKITKGGEVPAYSYVPNVVFGYTPSYLPFKGMPTDQRIERAKELLKAAGYNPDNPLSFELIYNSDRHGEHKNIALAIQGMWKAVGIDAKLTGAERAGYYERLMRHEYDVGRAGWIANFSDPIDFLEQFTSGNLGANYPHYHNAEYDKLIDGSRNTLDPAARMILLSEAEQLIMNEVVIIPLFHDASNHMVSPRLVGWEDNGLDVHLGRYLSLDQ